MKQFSKQHNVIKSHSHVVTSYVWWRHHRKLIKIYLVILVTATIHLFCYPYQNRHSEQELSTREREKYINQIRSSLPSKSTSKNKNKVAVAMATRETATTPRIFNREIKDLAQICTIVCTIILHPYFGFLLVQTRNNENHEFSQFFPEFIASRGKWI